MTVQADKGKVVSLEVVGAVDRPAVVCLLMSDGYSGSAICDLDENHAAALALALQAAVAEIQARAVGR